MNDSVVNHVGICVTDIERSRRFYRELLGFDDSWQLTPPDAATSALLRVDPPVNLTAVYLTRGPFVLELLHYDRPGNPSQRERPLNEPGLTHISFAVEDVAATCARVDELGGTIASGNPTGAAVMIRDPDGQMLELLPRGWQDHLLNARE